MAAVLPAPVGRAMAETAGVLIAEWSRLASGPLSVPAGGISGGLARRQVLVRRHLRRAYGPGINEKTLSRKVDAAFASYARYWVESLRLPSLTRSEVAAGISIQGMEHLHAARANGRGTILALPHLGGWDWGGTWLANAGTPVSVVVEALDAPEVFEWFVEFRRRLGMDVIPAGPDAGRRASRALADNRVLCLLSDRTVGDAAGVDVNFFGERTRLPAGPMTLAHRSGATILPAAVYFGPGSSEHRALIRPPVPMVRAGRLRDDVQRGTQLLAQELETLIRRAPTQWHLMQPNWPSDRV